MNPLDRARALFYKNIEAMKTASPTIRAELERENKKLEEEIFKLANEAEFQAHNEGNSNNALPLFFSATAPGRLTPPASVIPGDQDQRSLLTVIGNILSAVSRDDAVQLGLVPGKEAVAIYSEATPTPAPSGELAASHSTDFLTKINVVPVTDQEGERVLVGTGGPLAHINNSGRRNPQNAASLAPHRYQCRKVNLDVSIPYADLESWATVENYPELVKAAIDRQRALDRLLVGFNGTHYADPSDASTYPKRQDCGVGWLEKYRQEAPQRVISGLSVAGRDESNKIIASGDYGTIDALVLDGWQSAIAEQYRNGLVSICSTETLFRKEWPFVRHLSPDRPNYERLINDIMLKNPTIGGLPAVVVPFFPDDAVWVTPLSNISLYWQKNGVRKQAKDEPEYNRLAMYESRNDAYMVENYEAGCLIDGIDWR